MYPILYHGTTEENAKVILHEGTKVNRIGISYLSPKPEIAARFGPVVLAVEVPEEIRLSYFEDCLDWELLCWGLVPPERVKRYG